MTPTGPVRSAVRWKVRADDERGYRWLDDDGEFRFFECDATTFATSDAAMSAACVNYPVALSRDVKWVLVPVWEESS
jgi:hypothetical protein